MTLAVFTFYVFSTIVILAGLLTVLSRNPVHSVLWLILAFFTSAGLFVLLGAEFVAMLLVIVYVGAVAVLFLFVVMMLIGVVLLMELGLVFGVWNFADQAGDLRQAVTPSLSEAHNTQALGEIVYTQYIYLFQAAGLILLVAMIGAIVLTLRHRPNIKRQNIVAQINRDPAQAMELKNVKPGQGL